MRLLSTLGVLAVAVGMQAQDKPAEPKKLTPDEVKATMAKQKKVLFLDVREPREIEELGSMKGYVNIPLSDLERRMGEIPKDAVVLTSCNRGGRAARAAALLAKNGYTVAGACGMEEWKEKGYEVVYPKKP